MHRRLQRLGMHDKVLLLEMLLGLLLMLLRRYTLAGIKLMRVGRRDKQLLARLLSHVMLIEVLLQGLDRNLLLMHRYVL